MFYSNYRLENRNKDYCVKFYFLYYFLIFIMVSLICVLSTLRKLFLKWLRESFLRIQNYLTILTSETCQMTIRQILKNLEKSIIIFSSQFEPNLTLVITMSFCTLSKMLLRSLNGRTAPKSVLRSSK